MEAAVSGAVVLDPYSARPTDPDAEQVLDPYYQRTGRHVKLAVSWQSKAITRDLAPHLLSLTYADNLSGAADDLSLELDDRDGLWSGDWRPEFGDTVVARLEAEGWFGDDPVNSIRLGTFAHDKISLSGGGEGRRAALQCVSAPLSTGLRRRKRTHAWRGVTLKQIASDIANRSSMRLDFQGDAGPAYKQALQNDKSDLEFLEELCKEVGFTLKITESTIVIYDELTLDSGDAVGEISLTGGRVLAWSFDSDDSGRYGSCHVSCFDPRTGKTSHGQFPADGQTVPGLDPNGQTLELVIQVSDIGEALARAKALLRNANRFATSGKLTTVGDPGLVAGVIFNLTNAFGFDGKFIITRAEHHVGDGYVCSLDVRRCLEGY
jgi:phage protein D